jgi:excisionase family DNA binding protein
MPEAKFQIKRKCEICGSTFIAKTLTSKYCSRKCTNLAYKQRKAEQIKKERLETIAEKVPDARDYISVMEAVAIYNIGRDTLYRLIRNGTIPYINIGKRLTRINRIKLEELFSRRDEDIEKELLSPKLYNMDPENCYTIGDICKKYNINDSTVWAHIRRYSIPTRQIGNYVYAPKSEIDKLYKSL